MQIQYVPQLELLRELYQQPRSMDRFYWYLRHMLGEDDDGELDVLVPMTAANPMGREHCLSAEAGMRMCTDPRLERSGVRRRQFVVVPCWTSETYSPARIRELTRAGLFRFAHLYQHGLPRTLRDIVVLDGQARAFAGERPSLSAEELEYTAEVLIARPKLRKLRIPYLPS